MRIEIDLLAAQTETQAPGTPAVPGAPGTPAAPAGPLPPPELPPGIAAPPSAVRTIALDPGHGGEDDGAKGAAGTKEKDLTLAVAHHIKAAIEGRLGIRVLLNRETRAILGDGCAQGLAFADGGHLDADLVVVATGIRPNTDLARTFEPLRVALALGALLLGLLVSLR